MQTHPSWRGSRLLAVVSFFWSSSDELCLTAVTACSCWKLEEERAGRADSDRGVGGIPRNPGLITLSNECLSSCGRKGVVRGDPRNRLSKAEKCEHHPKDPVKLKQSLPANSAKLIVVLLNITSITAAGTCQNQQRNAGQHYVHPSFSLAAC
jgi:hypothetical protein